MKAMVHVDALRFRYGDGDFRLQIDRLDVERGSAVACVGPSGSGKTTLLNLVAGIVQPISGRVATDGVEVRDLAEGERRRFRVERIGLVFQEFELLEYLSVIDNILLPYRINNDVLRLDRAVRQRAAELARRVGIDDKLARRPESLSQGERQRVAVCRAILPRPPLLLADEPTGNLDPGNKDKVLDILFEYAAESGSTVLAVTHDHDVLGRFDRTIDFREFQGR
jgi:putative ABC transport system ATP-binding protein